MTHDKHNAGTSDQPEIYHLQLYVAGHTARSIQAINAVKAFCAAYLHGRYQLDIIDIYLNPDVAQQEDIITFPTLLRKTPLPQRKWVGDLSTEEKLRNVL